MTDLMAGRLFKRIGDAGIIADRRPYAVNIGCEDGRSYNDPCYPLYLGGFSGLAIDWADPPDLKVNLGCFPDVKCVTNVFVTPSNVADVLRDNGCPLKPTFLKMDIDGMDGSVLRSILASGFSPLVIQVEINPEIPPPFAFSILDSEYFQPGANFGFFGMSLQFSVDLLGSFDYALVEIDFETEYTHDALFVQRGLLRAVADLKEVDPLAEFLKSPALLPHITGATPETKASWRDRGDLADVFQEIWDALVDAGMKKHGHLRAPFTLLQSGIKRQSKF